MASFASAFISYSAGESLRVGETGIVAGQSVKDDGLRLMIARGVTARKQQFGCFMS